MSGAFPVARQREFDWTLRENQEQRRRRARAVRAIYAMVDPAGWDARRHFPNGKLAAALARVGHPTE